MKNIKGVYVFIGTLGGLLLCALAARLITRYSNQNIQGTFVPGYSQATLAPTVLQPSQPIFPTESILPSPTQPFSDVQRPVGVPVPAWQGVPVMPNAIAGQDFVNTGYSFVVNSSPAEVQEFYVQELAALGWNIPDGGFVVKGSGSVGWFERNGLMLNITVIPSPDDPNLLVVILRNQ